MQPKQAASQTQDQVIFSSHTVQLNKWQFIFNTVCHCYVRSCFLNFSICNCRRR